MDKEDLYRSATQTRGSAETSEQQWRRFGNASSESEFCNGWLALLCRSIPDVARGVVLLSNPTGDPPYRLAATWPEGPGDFKYLATAAERAIRERKGMALKRQADVSSAPGVDVAYPISIAGRVFAVVALDVALQPEDALRETMKQLQWGSAWLEVLYHRTLSPEDTSSERLRAVFALLASAISSKSFHGSAMALTTAVASRFECDRVSIGFPRRRSIRVQAMSHTGQFGQDTNLVRAIESAMNEALDQDSLVVYPDRPDRKAVATRSHQKLANESGNGVVCSIPLPGRAGTVGVLTLERDAAKPFDDDVLDVCESLGGLIGPVLETHRRDDRWLVRKALDSGLDAGRMLIGPSHVAVKLIVLIIIGLTVFLSRAHSTYRVTADAVLEPFTQQAIATAFDGYIRTAPVRAGDVVTKGQELATLDDREWQLERNRWKSQQDQSQRQYQEALGNGSASQAQIYAAQIAQAKAQVALLDEQIGRTRIHAPFDGVIVTGDLSQSLGAPVQRGQVLFQLAPLDAYRLILQVDERDIADIDVGQRGQLVLSSAPSDPTTFQVRRITPVSTTSEGRNYFRVEAQLETTPGRLRPGMEGVGKVEIENRLLLWIWTHQAIDWTRMKIWNWLP